MTRGWWIVLLTAGLQSAANLLLRRGILLAGGFPDRLADLWSGLLRLAAQPLFDIGFILYGLSALVWFRAIATLQLSTAYPLLVAMSFILVTAGAVLLFQEPFTWRKALGAVIIVSGIFLMGKE
jgi:multidrug transporter EmrE-like cation transporter